MRIGIVTAAAEGWQEEQAAAIALCAAAGVGVVFFAVNDVGVVHPDPLHHWASLHPAHFTHRDYRWEARRAEAGLACDYVRWGISQCHTVDRIVRTKAFRGGSSGLLGVDAALHGVELPGAICVGIPQDARPNTLNPKHRKGFGAFQRFFVAWEDRYRDTPALRDRTRSMSGNTRVLLGAPTIEWLDGLREAHEEALSAAGKRSPGTT